MKETKNNISIIEMDVIRARDHKLPPSRKDKIVRVTSEVLEQLRIYKARQEIKYKKRITFSDALQILLDEINKI